MTVRILIASLLSLALGASSASAQVRGLGRVQGVVVDSDGNTLGDVAVQTMTSTGVIVTGKSNATGEWSLFGLGKGEWTVSFKKPGFADKRVKLIIEKELTSSNPVKITMTKGS